MWQMSLSRGGFWHGPISQRSSGNVSLPAWPVRRLVLVWIGWIALGVAIQLWQGAANIEAGPADSGAVAVSAFWSLSWSRLLLFLLPPIVLTGLWLRSRRSLRG